jgi:hypothetical protein
MQPLDKLRNRSALIFQKKKLSGLAKTEKSFMWEMYTKGKFTQVS